MPLLLPEARCALTAPFHPYRIASAVYSLLHWPWAHAPQVLPGTLPYGARTFLTDITINAIAKSSQRSILPNQSFFCCIFNASW